MPKAPGFRLGDVVVAGAPSVMQAMLDDVIKGGRTRTPMLSVTIEAGCPPEDLCGDALGAIAAARTAVLIGSYPSFKDGKFRNQIVMRSKEDAAMADARAAVEAMVEKNEGDRVAL